LNHVTADDEVIQVSRGLLHFAKSDEEIAAIVSHQLAHNARKYQRTNKIIGVLGALSVAFSAERQMWLSDW
jgi:Zn-dependent protease with chaperone function